MQLRGVGGDPCIVVGNGEGGDGHVGTDLYFGKLKERFGDVGMYCLSLLKGEGEEANVLHAFHEGAAREGINVINFDWHDQVLAASFCCGFTALFFADSWRSTPRSSASASTPQFSVCGQ